MIKTQCNEQEQVWRILDQWKGSKETPKEKCFNLPTDTELRLKYRVAKEGAKSSSSLVKKLISKINASCLLTERNSSANTYLENSIVKDNAAV